MRRMVMENLLKFDGRPLFPERIAEVRNRQLTWIDKTCAAVRDRLTKEITYRDQRAEQLKLQAQAGKAGAQLTRRMPAARRSGRGHGRARGFGGGHEGRRCGRDARALREYPGIRRPRPHYRHGNRTLSGL